MSVFGAAGLGSPIFLLNDIRNLTNSIHNVAGNIRYRADDIQTLSGNINSLANDMRNLTANIRYCPYNTHNVAR